MCAKQRVLDPVSEPPKKVNLTWIKANHQSKIKSHTYPSNCVCEAGRRELSGCSESEGIEHRNNHRV